MPRITATRFAIAICVSLAMCVALFGSTLLAATATSGNDPPTSASPKSPPATAAANAGGAASADFDSLIDLITATVEPDSWMENGTGVGDIQPFPNGVYLDAAGKLCVASVPRDDVLATVRKSGRPQPISSGSPAAVLGSSADSRDESSVRRASSLRFVSLGKLEAEIARRQSRRERLMPEMLALAGLQRVTYVVVYPDTHDLVLAGPAGDWRPTPGGELRSVATGQPIARLDDLLTLWRRQLTEKGKPFGCSIVPRQTALADAQQYLAASAAEPIESSQRRRWLAGLRDAVGVQDVEYFAVDPDSRIARVLLAADYHMKLIGMGLVPGVPGVKSYLSTVKLGADGAPPPMTVLRWWFAMPDARVFASADHDAFALPENCVKVLSENELLAQRGERVHTGQSDELNRRFADSFTAAYPQLADKYPIYGELARLCEFSLTLAVIEREGLLAKAGWTPTVLTDAQRLRLPAAAAPRTVETVVNHRVIAGRHIIAGVSGGVWLDGAKTLHVSAEAVSGRTFPARSVQRPAMASDAAASSTIRWWWD